MSIFHIVRSFVCLSECWRLVAMSTVRVIFMASVRLYKNTCNDILHNLGDSSTKYTWAND